MPPQKKDVFTQFIAFAVTQSAANTLTFGQVGVGVSIFDYAAFLLHRIEFKASRATLAELAATTDELTIAITGSGSVSDIFDATDPQIYDSLTFLPMTSGTPATMQVDLVPVIHDFTGLPGGGLLVPAQNIFIGCQTAGFANPAVVTGRVHYTTKPMNASDYIELAQRLNVLTT